MSADVMIREAMAVSGGTIARLIGSGHYDDIDRAVLHWVQWIERQPDPSVWPTWLDCWDDYAATR